MKISTKGRYGLRALVDLASNITGTPVALANVAKRQNISLNYLEQVFGSLRRAGIVNSVKGSSGGYLLAKPTNSITVKEIIEALEGEFSIVDTKQMESRDSIQDAIQKLVWDEINQRVNKFMNNRTLEQLVAEYENQAAEKNIMYYI